MSSTLTLHELTGSPNSVKVRIGLGYKGLDYERKPLDMKDFPGDRTALVDISTQPRLPVLEDGTTVIFDSGAILRYLEANYPGTPPIFVEDYAAFAEVERWEMFARTQIGEPIGMMFQQSFIPEHDPQVVAKANQLLEERTGVLEDRLSTAEFLVGDHLTAGDIACAAPLYLIDINEEAAQGNPVAAFFAAHLRMAEGRDKTRDWVRRVLAHDPVFGQR